MIAQPGPAVHVEERIRPAALERGQFPSRRAEAFRIDRPDAQFLEQRIPIDVQRVAAHSQQLRPGVARVRAREIHVRHREVAVHRATGRQLTRHGELSNQFMPFATEPIDGELNPEGANRELVTAVADLTEGALLATDDADAHGRFVRASFNAHRSASTRV